MEAKKVLQYYFVENRSRLLDIAAYLDRLGESESLSQIEMDFRWTSFQKALQILVSEESNRVEKIHEILGVHDEIY